MDTTAGGERGSSPEFLSVAIALVLLVTDAARSGSTSPPGGHRTGERDAEEHASWSVRRSLAVLFARRQRLTVVSEVWSIRSTDGRIARHQQVFVGIILTRSSATWPSTWSRDPGLQEQMDFSLVTSLGSATQIALFAAPVLVLFGLLIGNELTLVFTPLEVVAVAVGTFIAGFIALDGRSNWVEGLQLISVYVILAIAFFFIT